MSLPAFLPPPAHLPGAEAYSRWGDHRHLAAMFDGAAKVMVLTGAGLSAPSGIPTYRGAGGKWTVSEPIYYFQFMGDRAKRMEQWSRSLDDLESYGGALPNPGHHALARLARRKDLFVATQNVDGLHGLTDLPPDRLVELHGNARTVVCTRCGNRTPFDPEAIRARVDDGRSPVCDCPARGLLKPGVVMFREELDTALFARARAAAEACTVFLAAGTSLQVTPAAELVGHAYKAGAVVVIANDGITPYHGAAHLLLAGDACAHLDAAVPAD